MLLGQNYMQTQNTLHMCSIAVVFHFIGRRIIPECHPSLIFNVCPSICSEYSTNVCSQPCRSLLHYCGSPLWRPFQALWSSRFRPKSRQSRLVKSIATESKSLMASSPEKGLPESRFYYMNIRMLFRTLINSCRKTRRWYIAHGTWAARPRGIATSMQIRFTANSLH